MANAHIQFSELRFILLADRTEVRVKVEPAGPIEDIPFQVLGWHYAYFEKGVSCLDIMVSWAKGEINPILWPTKEVEA
ncbi:hypothetical protein [Ferribacterium limneticum]|uniref:hypothetical protein n=1 Tax=Ferribacterium limneticum TaxID=76259 RepID=UPI001CF91D9D|nr:hypothetical protein [Ferribacterium limneticum]UCV26709.1 hypothetical protein KI617_10350 [Ferribacterium limneticum]UCV30626.1 hypothetical protein KI608_10350 [Ferribacterium limneticum]